MKYNYLRKLMSSYACFRLVMIVKNANLPLVREKLSQNLKFTDLKYYFLNFLS